MRDFANLGSCLFAPGTCHIPFAPRGMLYCASVYESLVVLASSKDPAWNPTYQHRATTFAFVFCSHGTSKRLRPRPTSRFGTSELGLEPFTWRCVLWVLQETVTEEMADAPSQKEEQPPNAGADKSENGSSEAEQDFVRGVCAMHVRPLMCFGRRCGLFRSIDCAPSISGRDRIYHYQMRSGRFCPSSVDSHN